MGKVETFEVLLASTKTEGSDWHWVGCDFQQRSDAVSATGVPVAERLGSKRSVIIIGFTGGLEGVGIVVGSTSTSTMTCLTVSLGTTEVLVVLVTEQFEGHRIVTICVVSVVTTIRQDLFVVVFIVVVVVTRWNIADKVSLNCVPSIQACFAFRVMIGLTFVVEWSRSSR